jgi:antitoxin VapB
MPSLRGYEKIDILYPQRGYVVMPLYIKDPEVDKLTEELIHLIKTTKVDAVKTALKHEIASRRGSLPIRERLAKSLAMARSSGPFAPGDHKREMDEMWGED